IQIGGDQAEFYLQDEKGLAMFQKFWDDGHLVGTHFHRQAYQGEPHRWANLRPSRPRQPRPQVPEGELFTPGMMSESNSLDEYREHWRGHFQFTNQLIARLSGLKDPAAIRKINNHGNNHTPTNWESAEVLFKEFGITVQTGGRNEMFNTLFDHDVFNPWRPSDQHETKEDLSNRYYVCVPQLAVVGNISPHFGMMQDLAVEAMKRRFLQIVAERREQQRRGLPPKIWNFGWTMHSYDLNPEGYQPPRRPAAAPKPPQGAMRTRRGLPRYSR
ncbi:MAG: hypothetical protein GY953_31535, partial [bacterium]|nr:hypothetical protein [bacterium]